MPDASTQQPRKLLTLCVLMDGSRVLLGMKKRGFGAGRWNGFGGKVEAGETIIDAAKREMREESGVEVGDISEVAVLDFSWEGKPGILEVHIFKATHYSGEPIETDEMRPAWYPADAIPFGEMWPDDKFWMPLFFAGKSFDGKFHFGDNDIIISHELHERVK